MWHLSGNWALNWWLRLREGQRSWLAYNDGFEVHWAEITHLDIETIQVEGDSNVHRLGGRTKIRLWG